ncbi:hypothetical protein IPL85_05940 [Candidatus Saccharibacteria bacterium]|nr:MAG: hypothetical protein IPL85_05940 [Candidatus Saccharibacteria bacterium]
MILTDKVVQTGLDDTNQHLASDLAGHEKEAEAKGEIEKAILLLKYGDTVEAYKAVYRARHMLGLFVPDR